MFLWSLQFLAISQVVYLHSTEYVDALFLQYQNCLRKFYHNTDSQVLLYLARTHYEAEQWQDCKKTLLRAIHLAPSNYTLRFDTGVALQKFSASTLQKTKRTVDEVHCNDLLLSYSPSSFILSFVKLKWMGSSILVPLIALPCDHFKIYIYIYHMLWWFHDFLIVSDLVPFNCSSLFMFCDEFMIF